MSDFRRMFEGESVTSASGGICLSCIRWRERPATWIRRGKVLKVLKVVPTGPIIIKWRKITRSLLSRSTRWWLSLYADTSRAVYSSAWIYLERCWWGDLADAVEDTRRRAGVQSVPELKVSSANPDWSTRRVNIHISDSFTDLIKKRCRIMREKKL